MVFILLKQALKPLFLPKLQLLESDLGICAQPAVPRRAHHNTKDRDHSRSPLLYHICLLCLALVDEIAQRSRKSLRSLTALLASHPQLYRMATRRPAEELAVMPWRSPTVLPIRRLTIVCNFTCRLPWGCHTVRSPFDLWFEQKLACAQSPI